MTKVTYYMYSYDTYCMSKEMMKMNDRDCAKCQNSIIEGKDVNFVKV